MFQSSNIPQVIEKIEPLKFVKFLRLDGWREFLVKNRKVKVFQKEVGAEFFQVKIPLDDELSDYNRAMFQAVQTVAQVKQETLEQTILTLLNPISDVLRFRLVSSHCEAGNVFFDDAIRLYSSAKKLIVAAASDVHNLTVQEDYSPSAVPTIQRNYTPKKVERFVNSCRFSQTEVGSCVVSVVLPLEVDEKSDVITQLEDATYSNAFARQTTRRIFDASDKIVNELNETDSPYGLIQATKNKEFSLDFLKALSKICDYDEKDKLEITARFSKIANGNKPKSEKIVLKPRYRNVLEKAVDVLKRQTAPKILSGVGKIEKLEAPSDLETRRYGRAVISTVFDSGRTGRLKIRLVAKDYAKACQAHEKGLFVNFSGLYVDDEFECRSFEPIETKNAVEQNVANVDF